MPDAPIYSADEIARERGRYGATEVRSFGDHEGGVGGVSDADLGADRAPAPPPLGRTF